MLGMKILTATRRILAGTPNKNRFEDAALTKAKYAKSEDRVNELGVRLLAYVPIAL